MLPVLRWSGYLPSQVSRSPDLQISRSPDLGGETWGTQPILLVGKVSVPHAFVVMVLVLPDVLIQMLGVDRDLDDIHLLSVQVHHKQAHPFALGTHEDESLLVAFAAGLADDPLPARAQLLLDHAVQLLAVHRRGEVVELRHMNAPDAVIGSFPGDGAENADRKSTR